MTQTAEPTTTLAIARRLAAANPAGKLPCPACGASLRADNFDKHLAKVHAALQTTGATSWAGADGRASRSLLAVMLTWTIGWFVVLAILPDAYFRGPLLAILVGLVGFGGLIVLASMERLPARLTLAGDELRVRYFFGLRGRRVRLPAAIEFGRAFKLRMMPTANNDSLAAPSVEESAGSYLRLTQEGVGVVVRCKHDALLEQHWQSPARGPKRDRWDISLDRAAFAALEYSLADRGVLAQRAD
jgi:hypothetical protein